jgi:hypothetical protein
MKSLKIITIPSGFAPEHIRTQWIGVTMPLPANEKLEEILSQPVARQCRGECFVLYEEATIALRAAGKNEAAKFYESQSFGKRLFWFRNEICQVLE